MRRRIREGTGCGPANTWTKLPGHDRGAVPSFMPGENPFLHEFADKHHLPQDAVLGGAKTMYPEYRETMNAASGAAAKK